MTVTLIMLLSFAVTLKITKKSVIEVEQVVDLMKTLLVAWDNIVSYIWRNLCSEKDKEREAKT